MVAAERTTCEAICSGGTGVFHPRMRWLIAVMLFVLPISINSSLKAADATYRHVVLFKFIDFASPEQIEGVESAFRALPAKIDTIQGLEWGINVSPENLNDGFTHCFFVTFKDKTGLDVYLPHTAHKEFLTTLRGIVDKVLVIDYLATH